MPRLHSFWIVLLASATVSCSSPYSRQLQEVQAPVPETATAPPATAAPQNIIVPGERVGLIVLGQTPEQVNSIAGKPDRGDAAMGKALSTWYSNSSDSAEHQLNVFFVRTIVEEQEAFRVQQIRVTSPDFTTADGIRPGITLDSIRYQYFPLRRIAFYPDAERNRVYLYQAPAQGISFEIAASDSSCVAITVHSKGKEVLHSYLPVKPELQYLDKK